MVTLPLAGHPPCRVWNIGRRWIGGQQRPLVMAILNVTPDSFSDGGRYRTVDDAVAAALQMQQAGADIIDIGGESTRPYSQAIAGEEEQRRVLPVIERLAGRLQIPISIDTRHAAVADAAVRSGAEIINDISGLEGDPAMLAVAAEHGVGVCLMHMQGTPQTMQDAPAYQDVVEEVYAYLLRRYQACVRGGIDPQRICLDPGIGFGKTHAHNLLLLQATDRLTQLPAPLLIGHSRKGFIGKLLGDADGDRDAGSIGVALAVAAAGAAVIRVHAVAATVQALELFAAAGGLRAANLPGQQSPGRSLPGQQSPDQ